MSQLPTALMRQTQENNRRITPQRQQPLPAALQRPPASVQGGITPELMQLVSRLNGSRNLAFGGPPIGRNTEPIRPADPAKVAFAQQELARAQANPRQPTNFFPGEGQFERLRAKRSQEFAAEQQHRNLIAQGQVRSNAARGNLTSQGMVAEMDQQRQFDTAALMPNALVQKARTETQGAVDVSANKLKGTQAQANAGVEIAGIEGQTAQNVATTAANAQRFDAEQRALPTKLGFEAFNAQQQGGGTPTFLPAALQPMPQAEPEPLIVLDQGQASFDPTTGRQIASNAAPTGISPQERLSTLTELAKQASFAGDTDAAASYQQQIEQLLAQGGGQSPLPQSLGQPPQGAGSAQPLPANATPNQLQNGVVYQTRQGPKRWDAMSGFFLPVGE